MFQRSRIRQHRAIVYGALRLLTILGLALLLPLALSARAAGPQEVKLTATEFSFTPKDVTLTAGQPVHLTVVNAGKVSHDIKSSIPISDLKYIRASNDTSEQQANAAKGILDVDFDAGTTAEVTFTPTKAGTYTFFCDVPGHKEAGMTGSFVVKEAAAPAASATKPAAAAAPSATAQAPSQAPKTGGGAGSTSSTRWYIILGVLAVVVLGGGVYAVRQRSS